MTKTELIKKMADDCGLTYKDAETLVNMFFGCITSALISGDGVELRGFGSFRVKQREARQGRNPKTGVLVEVPGKSVPFFKPGRELRSMLNEQPRSHSRPKRAE